MNPDSWWAGIVEASKAQPIFFPLPGRYRVRFDSIMLPRIRSLEQERGITCKEDMERLYDL
jgi:hypothetical protein